MAELNKFMLRVNNVIATALEVLNPVIAVVVLLGVLNGVTDDGGDGILGLLLGAAAAIAVSGPIAVLTNIRGMLRDATRDRLGTPGE